MIKKFQSGKFKDCVIQYDPNALLWEPPRWLAVGSKQWADPPDEILDLIQLYVQSGQQYADMSCVEFIARITSNE